MFTIVPCGEIKNLWNFQTFETVLRIGKKCYRIMQYIRERLAFNMVTLV